MTEFVDKNWPPKDMRLRVERLLSGKIWWFDLVGLEEVWAEFYEKLPGIPQGRQNSPTCDLSRSGIRLPSATPTI